MFSAFLVITIVSYVNVTASKLMVAAKEMHDETTFILEQTKESLRHDEEVSGPSVTSNTKGSMLEKLFAGHPEELDGFVIAARNGTILGANFNPDMIGTQLEDTFDADILKAAEKSATDGTPNALSTWDQAQAATSCTFPCLVRARRSSSCVPTR